MIRKRTHFLVSATPGQKPNSVTWKIWQFANDLGLLAEMVSHVWDERPALIIEILGKHFGENSCHAFQQGEFADFVSACRKAHRAEINIVGGSQQTLNLIVFSRPDQALHRERSLLRFFQNQNCHENSKTLYENQGYKVKFR